MALACRLLALILAAATVLTVPAGSHKLVDAARTSRAEAFWRTALPGASMPEAIRELLRPHADKTTTVLNDEVYKLTKDERDDPPPMNFNYDDYKAASRRNGNPAPSAEVLNHAAASAQNAAAATSPTLFFLEDAVRAVPGAATTGAPADGLDPPRLLHAVRAALLEGGSSFVVCRREAGGPGDGSAVTYVCRAREYAADVAGGRGDDATQVLAAAGNHKNPVLP